MGKLDDNRFARSCAKENGEDLCMCDCRINITGCPQETIHFIALTCLVPFTILIVIISISFLYYRVKVKGQSVFFPSTRERGLIRPRPQDSFHIAVGIFNFCQMIVLILLITESFPNVMFAEIIVHIPKLLGFACAVLYPISIIYSTPILRHATYSLRTQWSPNKYFIDGLAIYLMLGPLLTIIPLTALTGHFADWKNFERANDIFMIQAFVWSCWTIQYFLTLLYVYYKLIFMLKGYVDILQRRTNENPDVKVKLRKLKSASFNLTWIVFAVFLMFFINSLEGILVGINYNGKPNEANKNICEVYYFISWNFTIPILSFIGQLIFFYGTLKSRKSIRRQQCSINTYDRLNNIQSHMEQRPRLNRDNANISADSKSLQKSKSSKSSKSTTLLNSNNSGSTRINNSDVRTAVFSSTNGTSNWDKDKYYVDSDISNHNFDNFDYYDEVNLIAVPLDIRKSWLFKKPVRTPPAKKETSDDSLFFQD